MASLSQDERDALAAEPRDARGHGARIRRQERARLGSSRPSPRQGELLALFEHMQRVNQAIQKSPGGSLTAYYAGQR